MESHRSQLVDALLSASPAYLKLHEAMHDAQQCIDLESVMEEANGAFRRSELNASECDSLAREAAQRSTHVPYSLADMSLSTFAQSGLSLSVHSAVLDETIVLAADNATIPDGGELVVYRACELAEMVGMPNELLRAVHATKKAMDGELVAEAESRDAPSEDSRSRKPGRRRRDAR